MEYADLEILHQIRKWLEAGEKVMLITVIKTWGSAPRPAGSIMAINSRGRLAGSVSGGCIEEDLIEKVRGPSGIENTPKIIRYGGGQEQQRRFKLPCGGTVELLIESITSYDPFSDIQHHIEKRECISREVDVATGKVKTQPAQSIPLLRFDGQTVKRVFGPQWRLLIIGAGQLSQHVAQMAILLGYQITISDPRDEYANSWAVENTTLTQLMPDDTVIGMGIDQQSAVLALTHDPKLDDMALLEALTSKAFYIGALGSRATSSERRKRLKFLGISQENLDKLRGPVGLAIGSRTPAEIAISILADMISVRNKNHKSDVA